jgi:hypothetical protein
MSPFPDAAEDPRQQRLRELMDKAITADRESTRVLPLINTTFEVSVRDMPGPARRATVLAVESGLALLEYEGSPPEQYWVPIVNIQWLKVIGSA